MPSIDPVDVPPVSLEQILVPLREAIANGQGLALLNGLSEEAIRDLEGTVWSEISCPKTRVAVALRFRALLDVFRARRLKHLFLMNGFKLIARAAREASSQRLNASYGFNAQKFVFALAAAPAQARPQLRAVDLRAVA